MQSKRMFIFEKPGGKLKQDLSLSGIKCVIQLSEIPDVSSKDQVFSPKTIKSLSNLPTDFPEPLGIFLKD
jgi:hypothetical protein